MTTDKTYPYCAVIEFTALCQADAEELIGILEDDADEPTIDVMKPCAMPIEGKKFLKAVKDIVKMYWDDESRHFHESERPRNHIFRSLMALNQSLRMNLKDEYREDE